MKTKSYRLINLTMSPEVNKYFSRLPKTLLTTSLQEIISWTLYKEWNLGTVFCSLHGVVGEKWYSFLKYLMASKREVG